MRFRRMRGLRRMVRVRGVEVGVEAHRVITVAPQRSDAVVMGHRLQRVADGVRQDRMRR